MTDMRAPKFFDEIAQLLGVAITVRAGHKWVQNGEEALTRLRAIMHGPPKPVESKPVESSSKRRVSFHVVCVGEMIDERDRSFQMYDSRLGVKYWVPKMYLNKWLPTGEAVVARDFIRVREQSGEPTPPWRELTPEEEEPGVA